MTTMNEVASTILSQFGGMRALSMIGGMCLYDKTSITVPFNAKSTNKSNRLVIKYAAADDTYTMEFWSCRGIKTRQIESFDMVYCDQLQEIFESKTGLYLSL